jgi:hypothetical protein
VSSVVFADLCLRSACTTFTSAPEEINSEARLPALKIDLIVEHVDLARARSQDGNSRR